MLQSISKVWERILLDLTHHSRQFIWLCWNSLLLFFKKLVSIITFKAWFEIITHRTFLVFKTYLQYVFLKRLPRRLQDVFKTSSRRLPRRLQDVLKTCLQDVLLLCLQDVLEDKKMLHWRRLQYVFTKANVCREPIQGKQVHFQVYHCMSLFRRHIYFFWKVNVTFSSLI